MTSVSKGARWAGAVGMVVCATAGALLLAGPSQAGVIGTLGTTPATGTTSSSITFTTSGPCTDANATNLEVGIFGAGFPSGGQRVVGNTSISAFQTASNGGYVIPLAQTLRDYGNIPTPPVTFSGKYDFVAKCRTATGLASLGDFTTSIWFTSPTAYQSTDPASGGGTPTPTATTASPAPTATGTSTASPSPSAPTSTPTGSAHPTASPSAGTLVAVDGTGAPLPTNPVLRAGEHVTVTASGFVPKEQVTATLHSTPRSLTPMTAGSDGVLHYPFLVPADFAAGAHTLELKGATLTVAYPFRIATSGATGTVAGTSPGTTTGSVASGASVTTSGSVSSARLPRTGFDATRTAGLAALLVLGGVLLVGYGRGVVGGARGRHRYVALHAAGRRAAS